MNKDEGGRMKDEEFTSSSSFILHPLPSGTEGTESRVRLIPRLRVPRLVVLDVKTVAHDAARVGQGFDVARRHRLHEDVADRGRLDGPGDDGPGAGVGGH